IDETLGEFDRKLTEVEGLIGKLGRQFSLLTGKARGDYVRRLDTAMDDLASIPDSIEKDITNIEGRNRNQSSITRSDIEDLRRKLDITKTRLTRIQEGSNTSGDFGLLILPDGRKLVRVGPIELLEFDMPRRHIHTFDIYAIDPDGELLPWLNLVERVSG